jgi:hypothetical protein
MEVPIELDSNEGIKKLGLLWHPLSDQFLISKGTCVQKLQEPKNRPVSKRIISSIVAAVFYPLGFNSRCCTQNFLATVVAGMIAYRQNVLIIGRGLLARRY